MRTGKAPFGQAALTMEEGAQLKPAAAAPETQWPQQTISFPSIMANNLPTRSSSSPLVPPQAKRLDTTAMQELQRHSAAQVQWSLLRASELEPAHVYLLT